MKFLIDVTCPTENDAPSSAYIEINKSEAAAILALMDMAVGFRTAASDKGLACKFNDISVGVGGELPYFHLSEIGLAGLSGPHHSNPIYRLPDGFDFSKIEDENGYSVECRRIRLDEKEVDFTAVGKYCDSEFTLASLPREFLETIAAGGVPDVPYAVPESFADKLEKLAMKLKLTDGDLDETVTDLVVAGGATLANQTGNRRRQNSAIDAAEKMASEINNGGIIEQILYIAKTVPDQAEKLLKKAAD